MLQPAFQSSEIHQSPGVIESLECVRDRVKHHLMKVPEYRALLAIENAIVEVLDIPDLMDSLESARGKITDRLKTVREFQAMLAVEKAIKEISEVLGVLGEDSANAAAPLPDQTTATKESSDLTAAAVADGLAKALGLTSRTSLGEAGHEPG